MYFVGFLVVRQKSAEEQQAMELLTNMFVWNIYL